MCSRRRMPQPIRSLFHTAGVIALCRVIALKLSFMGSICFLLRLYLKYSSSPVLFHDDDTCETIMIRTGNATCAIKWKKCQRQGKLNKHCRQIRSAGAMQKVYFRKPGDWLVGEIETQWDAHSELMWASCWFLMNSWLRITGLELCHDGLVKACPRQWSMCL